MSTKAEAVANVDIDGEGRFKYVLIKLYYGDADEEFKYIVRGYGWAGFHADVYEDTVQRVEALGLQTECVGGGRILHKPHDKSILVYGYSQGYGRPDHSITVDVLKKHYKDYSSITFSNEGY